MARIRQLNRNVINKIAAGEVIERPASVVKELLENAVDALATRIEVDVAGGGSELIRVVDDGEGIHPDDMLLTVSSHATSKIDGADDLFHVRTLGFRGEALASIAEVSEFRLRSRQPDRAEGMELEVRGGRISEPTACGSPAGTLIEVRNLFCNTPVRRKFLKTTPTELAHLSEQFTRIALANPRLHMVLRHNGKLVYELPATSRLIDRLELFYGSELSEMLISIESEIDGVKLWGYAAHPSRSKSNRKGQYLFLNGRWIQDRSLQHALSEAYRGLLMVGRFPITFLFLEVPPDRVDVNVHPTKSEVRFLDGQNLYRQLLSTLRTTFLSSDLDGHLQLDQPAGPTGRAASPAVTPEARQEAQRELVAWAGTQVANWNETPSSQTDSGSARETNWGAASAGTIRQRPALAGWQAATGAEPSHASLDVSSHTQPAGTPEPGAEDESLAQQEIPRAMQIHDSYIVVEMGDGLTVIDQHALHERILYEQLREKVLAHQVESQRLLVPETVELSATEAGLLTEHHELLAQLGLGLESFGGGTVAISRYPALLTKANLGQLVRDIAEQLTDTKRGPTRRDLLDELLHMMSCKAAVKAGHRLTPEEIDSLLVQRHLVHDAHHCPHGRPTALVLSRADLDRQFGRMG